MRSYSGAAWERAMKVQEVILRAMAKRITRWQAAEILGISDRQSHFFETPKAGGPIDEQRLTQVGRAMKELGIRMIPSYSPQARGRSERNFGTWQGRLQRMGNSLINELIIGIGSKDRFSMDQPRNDSQFASSFLDPPIVHVVEALHGGALAVPSALRVALLPLVTYAAPIAPAGTPAGPIADLLRLNTGVPATPLGSSGK